MLSQPRFLSSVATSLQGTSSLGRVPRRAETAAIPEEQELEAGVRALLYDAEPTDGHVSIRDIDVEKLTAEQLLWVDVTGEQEVARTAAAFELTPETVRALSEPSGEPALFTHDEYVHLIVIAPANDGEVHTPQLLHCLVGSNWALTVHAQPIDFLGHLDDRMRGNTNAGRIDSHSFLAAILHEHVTSYLAEVRPIEADLDRIDLRSMTGRIDEEALLRELVNTRVRLAKLRRLLEPHREVFPLLARSEFAILSGSNEASDFQSLTELLERTLQSMETTREMIVGSFEIYTTWTAHGTNKVMKRLTIASVTLLPPTLLAGVMGMNSLPAGLATTTAFWSTTAAMSSLAFTTISLAWLRKWI